MTTSNEMDKLNIIIEKIFKIPQKEINDQLSSQTVSTWDSFNYLTLISEIEKEFNVSFSMDDVLTAKNLGDIKAAMRRMGVAL